MKQTIILFLTLLMSYCSFGQNNTDLILSGNSPEDIMPVDIDEYLSLNEGCGIPIFNDAYTYMDTFRVLFRKPFSKYLLGEYYCGYILHIDSISTESPYIDKKNDSIRYVYALFSVVEQYASPYNKEIYWSPIPDDIRNDCTNDFQYYKQLHEMLNDTAIDNKHVCVMMTKQEMEILESSTIYQKEILLRMTSDAETDSSGIVFCFQPFMEDYTKNSLLSRKQIAMYKILRYEQLYHDAYKKELPCRITIKNKATKQ